ncbi:hypothetical protein BS47DRAFT_1290421 [Hydnum rufescens UP504]|uniref:D-lactate dehydratase n=1 Tax=Hydnum rufescens UP504 TaxID=1448309 RepID=A0A9P6B5J1_9AGAM|nr:hypothetical protein BS47DRAFT_1290421 [Hydnum rufescens UP504]
MPDKTALILVADGTEEIELYDLFVRAGIKPTSAFVGATSFITAEFATCSRGLRVVPDVNFHEIEDNARLSYDVLVIPGGMEGAKTLSQNIIVQDLVRAYIGKNKIVGMICAGTLTALTSGLPRQPLTSHPSVREQLEKSFDYSEDQVVVSGSLVTSRGPGSSFDFALQIIALLLGDGKRSEVAGPLMYH